MSEPIEIRLIDLRAGEEPPQPERAALDPDTLDKTRAICEDVRVRGDAALVEFTQRFDGADIVGRIQVSDEELDAARSQIPDDLAEAIEATHERLVDLHGRQLPSAWEAERDGVVYGEVVKPVSAAGCYVPGGRASYPSTLLMTATPARVAGVDRVVVCTPPDADGSLPAPVRYAARVAGVDTVYRVGGAQAIAAIAYGTESVARVDTIVGPGNIWVTAAKAVLTGVVGIDALAGPSELVIVADGTADPAVLAVDLIAQAEHDPLAKTILVSTDEAIAREAIARLADEVEASPRRDIVKTALLGHAAVVIARDEAEACKVADDFAAEHLQIVTADPRATLARIRAYGAAFLGPATPVSFGDYGVGSNHVLPTMANARFASGLRAADFVTVSSVLEASPEAVERTGPSIETIAEAEGLPAHARASRIRRSP